MATLKLKFTDNGLGLWKTEDGQWGIFDQGEDRSHRWRLQRKTGPDPWDWEIIGVCREFEEAAMLATEMQGRRWV